MALTADLIACLASRRPGGASCVWGVMLVVFGLVSPACLSQDDVLIVVSSESEYFRAAADSCESTLRGGGRLAEIMTLEEFVARGGGDGASAWVAIGPRTLAYLAPLAPRHMPLYHALSPAGTIAETSGSATLAGVTSDVSPGEQVRLMLEARPRAKRLGVLYRNGGRGEPARTRTLRRHLPPGVQLVARDLDGGSGDIDAIRDVLRSRIDFLWLLPDANVYTSAIVRTTLTEALREGVPVFGFSERVVLAGCLLGVGIDPARQGERVARLVLAGARQAMLDADPVVAVNTIVSARLGIDLPRSLRDRADVVFDGSQP